MDGTMKRLFDTFERAGKELFLVGGAVRDLALGIPMSELDDLDFCTNARPQETLDLLKSTGFATYDMGFEFGTVGCVLTGPKTAGFPKDCQVTTYRSEEYYRRGSRHPVVRFGDTIMQDLKRRDFSINSIALDHLGHFVDPYDGLLDLRAGILRVVGVPLETLAEDPLRILRVGRFVSRFGFKVDDALREAAENRADHILDISRERWLQEFTKLLKGDHVADALRFLRDVRILGIILPEVAAMVGFHESSDAEHKDIWEHTLKFVDHCPTNDTLRWAALLHDIGKVWTRVGGADTVRFPKYEAHGAMMIEGIAQRFRFDQRLATEVRFVVENHTRIAQDVGEWTDAAVRRFVREMDPHVELVLAFSRIDLGTADDPRRRAALTRIDDLEARIRALDAAQQLRPELPAGIGKDIMSSFDLRPGPVVGHYKSLLEERIIEGDIPSGESAEFYLEYLQKNPPSVDGIA
jgi:poly(A) polymerase